MLHRYGDAQRGVARIVDAAGIRPFGKEPPHGLRVAVGASPMQGQAVPGLLRPASGSGPDPGSGHVLYSFRNMSDYSLMSVCRTTRGLSSCGFHVRGAGAAAS
jgi:hypothetical protein